MELYKGIWVDLNTSIILAVIILTVLAGIYDFMKRPGHERTLEYALNKPNIDLENKLKTYPKSAGAVIIKGDKKKAFLHNLPMFLYFFSIVLF